MAWFIVAFVLFVFCVGPWIIGFYDRYLNYIARYFGWEIGR